MHNFGSVAINFCKLINRTPFTKFKLSSVEFPDLSKSFQNSKRTSGHLDLSLNVQKILIWLMSIKK